MGYELLRGLYLGNSSNADLTSQSERQIIHVKTPLDGVIPTLLATGRDVVVTGNPGDGKSHLIRTLFDRGRLDGAEVELDLSAKDEAEVIRRWEAAALAGTPFILCANEGPLITLLAAMSGNTALTTRREDVLRQLGRLITSSAAELPPEPSAAYVVDLADRELLDPAVIGEALQRVCKRTFIPDGEWATESILQGSIDLFASEAARRRFGRVLTAAGRRSGLHVSFRQLWAAVSYAICGGESLANLQRMTRTHGDGTGRSPLDRLTSGLGQGALLDAVQKHADPATAPWPDLDEDIWFAGKPSEGRWESDDPSFVAPAKKWQDGDQAGAVARFRTIKRLVALDHTVGDQLLDLLEGDGARLSARSDDQLCSEIMLGIRRLFVSEREEAAGPSWLSVGVPVWSSLTYSDSAAADRPHVAVSFLPPGDLEVRRPHRPPWLGEALGPAPDLAWLHHRQSGVRLRVDGEMLHVLRHATTTDGPSSPPEPVQRFLARIAGWQERAPLAPATDVAFLDAPRGHLVAATITHGPDGARYGASHVGR